jgi:hypothetical protein
LFHVVGPGVPISALAKRIFLDFGSYKTKFADSKIRGILGFLGGLRASWGPR